LCQTALIKNNEGSKLITALVRAVREDEREDAAKKCESFSSPVKMTYAGSFFAEIIRGRR
jgi:hypothetical protein